MSWNNTGSAWYRSLGIKEATFCLQAFQLVSGKDWGITRELLHTKERGKCLDEEKVRSREFPSYNTTKNTLHSHKAIVGILYYYYDGSNTFIMMVLIPFSACHLGCFHGHDAWVHTQWFWPVLGILILWFPVQCFGLICLSIYPTTPGFGACCKWPMWLSTFLCYWRIFILVIWYIGIIFPQSNIFVPTSLCLIVFLSALQVLVSTQVDNALRKDGLFCLFAYLN